MSRRIYMIVLNVPKIQTSMEVKMSTQLTCRSAAEIATTNVTVAALPYTTEEDGGNLCWVLYNR